jgi:hypothetical protein
MPIWLLLLQVCWFAAFVGLGFKVWLLSVDMLDNLTPEAPSRWKFMLLGRTPHSEELNEKGQILRRQFFRLLWIFAALFFSGAIVLNLGKILA